MSHQLANSFFSCRSHDVHIPAFGRGSIIYSFWIFIDAFGLENRRLLVISVHTKPSPQSTNAVECRDDQLISEGFESLSHLLIGCRTIRYKLDVTGGLDLEEENRMFVALHDEDCGEIDGLRICRAFVLGNDHVVLRSRKLVEEETIIRAIVFSFIDLA
jgi:hypothetical protein